MRQRKINYPLIISDFDGTLVNEDGSITAKNKAAIEEYTRCGGKFILSSGRMPLGIIPRAKELGLKGMVSACQGGLIIDMDSDHVAFEGKLPYETTLKIVKKMEEMGLHIQAYDLWEYYSNMDDEALRLYENVLKSKAKLVVDRPLSQFIEETKLESYKVLAMVAPKDSEFVLQALEKEGFEGCVVTKSAPYLIEVVSAAYSKGTAVEFLAKHYNVPMEKTVAVGDQLNDLPMIERAGIGVAVKNADDRLKARADFISPLTNEESAIADIIERFGFAQE